MTQLATSVGWFHRSRLDSVSNEYGTAGSNRIKSLIVMNPDKDYEKVWMSCGYDVIGLGNNLTDFYIKRQIGIVHQLGRGVAHLFNPINKDEVIVFDYQRSEVHKYSLYQVKGSK